MNLKLFQGRTWDQLTDREFDIVARALVRASHTDHYTIESVCLYILLEVNDLEVLYGNAVFDDPGSSMEQVYWLRKRQKPVRWWHRLVWWRRAEPPAPPFALPLYMLHYWCKPKNENGAGMFDWLISGSRRTKSPVIRKLAAPRRYMSDWSWQQYRAVTDYYEQYVRVSNAVARGKLSAAYLDDARAQWLATIFCRRVWYRDTDNGLLRYGFHYRPGQATANQRLFRHVTEVEFQKIMLWWEGMQHHLQQQYPKCYKRGNASSDRSDPLSVYSRSIATLEKYTGSDEETINRKTYTVILQQLNDMVLQNEEYEKLRH